ncbi:MAG TPA: molybdopterin cofactor-binding domain-containing protein [Candidatus Sulfotelmatobacter sp.]|jgi:CO/xanthine dehydrogenase Mo-binding subunit|nr:molybdopterin cofactor-binding domain-containing protein [Candidatus Sulfotelmatobacter sp.]
MATMDKQSTLEKNARKSPRNGLSPTLSRRQFIKAGGILVVGFSFVGPELLKGDTAKPATFKNSLDPTLATSWIEIHPDNTLLIRTGKSDFGQGSTFTAYRQIVAEELSVPFEAITTVVAGHTDLTPDGSGAFDFLGHGTPNIRKAAAYTYQALLDLASEKLGAPKDKLSVKDGVVSGGGKSISYGDLIKNQQLKLTIPVKGDLTSIFGLSIEGNPPMKPVSEYTIIGKSFKNSIISSKVQAKETWATDVRLPGMLHARVVHPKTLGSTLVSAGQLDKKRFPNSQVIVKGNLVGVVAPTEWEAIQAAEQVAGVTKWTDWKGLPGNAKLYQHLREEADWTTAPVSKGNTNKGDVAPILASAHKKLSTTYQLSYMKHAPIGPTMAVADVKTDGTVQIYTHNQNLQALRGEIAMMLRTTPDHVIVHSYPGPGHYGRSNGGNAGAEDEAVLLSQAVGKPVRVQWMRADDMQWSTQSAAAFSDVQIALDEKGKIAAYQMDHYMPAMQDDRPIGAVLAGLPTMPAPEVHSDSVTSTVNGIEDDWIYAPVPNVMELGHGTFQVGQKASPLAVGLRDHSMRTPGQFQQNFPRELAINEAAALAGADAIQFRIDHATEERIIGVLKAVRDASSWDTRPSPRPDAVSTGATPLRGRGVSLMLRSGTYWACVCQIAVTPSTGKIVVEKYTIAVDPGIVVNPAQLKRQVEGGAVMGISHALFEEVTFDESGITTDDWNSYPIPSMSDVPEIKVVLLNNPKVGAYGGGSEAANALGAPAIAAALHDATGKVLRRLPLKPAYVQAVLKS